jgi:hypothetical protein
MCLSVTVSAESIDAGVFLACWKVLGPRHLSAYRTQGCFESGCQHCTRVILVLRPPPDSGKNLQAQYERWQPRAKYKMHLDPTLEDVKKLCVSCRRTAKVGS